MKSLRFSILLSVTLFIGSVSAASEQCLAVYSSSQFESSMFQRLQESLSKSPNKMPSLLVIDSISQSFKKVEQKYAVMIAALTCKLSDANITAKLEVLSGLDQSFQKLDKTTNSIEKDLSNPKIVKQLDHIGAQFFQMKQQIDLLEPQLRTAIEKSLQIKSQIEILNGELSLLTDELIDVKNNLEKLGWKEESDYAFVRNILDQKLIFLTEMSASLSAVEKNLKTNIYSGLTQLEVSYEFMRHRLVIHEASGIKITPPGMASRDVVKLGDVKNKNAMDSEGFLGDLKNQTTKEGQSLLSAFEKLPREQALSMFYQVLWKNNEDEAILSISDAIKLVNLAYPDSIEPKMNNVFHSYAYQHKLRFFESILQYRDYSRGESYVKDLSEKTYAMLFLIRKLVDKTPNKEFVEYVRDLIVNDMEYTITKWEEHRTAVINWKNTPFYKKSFLAKKPKAFPVLDLGEVDRIISALYIKKTQFENDLLSYVKGRQSYDVFTVNNGHR